MKILMITSLYHPHNRGGGEISIKTIAESLYAEGNEVAVLATSDKKGLSSELINGVRVWRAGIKNVYWHHDKAKHSGIKKALWHLIDVYNPSMIKYADTVFKKVQPDVIQIHAIFGWSSSILRWAAKQKVLSVQVLHGYELACPKANTFKDGQRCLTQCLSCNLAKMPHKHFSNKLNGVVGISNSVLKKYASFGFFKDVGVKRTIYNARNPEMIGLTAASTLENALDLSSGANLNYPTHERLDNSIVRFGFMGNIAQMKGVELLLETFKAHAPPNAELWIAGTGVEDYVQPLHARFGDSKTRFVGKSFPAQFFRDIDVAIVPSLWDEPLGVVVFEALAFGCPVIGSSRGGIPEMIQVGVSGLVFDPDEPMGLANAISLLAQDSQLRNSFAENARRSVEHFLSTSRIANEYVDFYNIIRKDS